MDIQVEWLKKEDAPEALDFLNMVFSMAGRPHQFREMLPKMWEYDGAYNNKHLAVRENGRIRSLLGVYPLPTTVAGERLLFSTVGNVATHPDSTGKGYMSLLLGEAMKKLDELDADASRLGGKRERYGRYGYEAAGVQYHFTVTKSNAERRFGRGFCSGIDLAPIEKGEEESLLFCKSLFERSPVWVDRLDAAVFYDSLTAWRNLPYLATRGGEPVGYLTVTPDGGTVTEVGGLDTGVIVELLCTWLQKSGRWSISLPVDPWQTDLLRTLQGFCEDWRADIPSQFYIRRWDRVVTALMRLKNTLSPLSPGEMTLGVEGYGSLFLKVGKGEAFAERRDTPAELTLDRLTATRLIFGMLPPWAVCPLPPEIARLAGAWFPLPLGWNTLDRV